MGEFKEKLEPKFNKIVDQKSFGSDFKPESAQHSWTFTTNKNQAIIYRLSGDPNPLHIDPGFSSAMGFETPILHGLCFYGISCRAFMETFPDLEVEKIGGRFLSSVIPGDELKVVFVKDGDWI